MLDVNMSIKIELLLLFLVYVQSVCFAFTFFAKNKIISRLKEIQEVESYTDLGTYESFYDLIKGFKDWENLDTYQRYDVFVINAFLEKYYHKNPEFNSENLRKQLASDEPKIKLSEIETKLKVLFGDWSSFKDILDIPDEEDIPKELQKKITNDLRIEVSRDLNHIIHDYLNNKVQHFQYPVLKPILMFISDITPAIGISVYMRLYLINAFFGSDRYNLLIELTKQIGSTEKPYNAEKFYADIVLVDSAIYESEEVKSICILDEIFSNTSTEQATIKNYRDSSVHHIDTAIAKLKENPTWILPAEELIKTYSDIFLPYDPDQKTLTRLMPSYFAVFDNIILHKVMGKETPLFPIPKLFRIIEQMRKSKLPEKMLRRFNVFKKMNEYQYYEFLHELLDIIKGNLENVMPDQANRFHNNVLPTAALLRYDLTIREPTFYLLCLSEYFKLSGLASNDHQEIYHAIKTHLVNIPPSSLNKTMTILAMFIIKNWPLLTFPFFENESGDTNKFSEFLNDIILAKLHKENLLVHPEICVAMHKINTQPKFNAVRIKMSYITRDNAWNDCEQYINKKKTEYREQESKYSGNTLSWTYV